MVKAKFQIHLDVIDQMIHLDELKEYPHRDNDEDSATIEQEQAFPGKNSCTQTQNESSRNVMNSTL